jgi:hypothetical protein
MVTSSVGGHLRRGVGTAWQVGFGNSKHNVYSDSHTLALYLFCTVGGIIAPFLFLPKDSPEYRTGYSVCLSFLCISTLASTTYFVKCVMENRQRDKGLSERVGKTSEEKVLLGDLHPDYRYML